MKKAAAANIDLGTPAPPARNVRRKGKKSVPYYDDPEILKRLATVAENMAKASAHKTRFNEALAELGRESKRRSASPVQFGVNARFD